MACREILAFLLLTLAANAADHEVWKASINETTRLIDAGQYHAAEPVVIRALQEAEGFGPNDIRVAYSLRQLGVVSYCLGRFPESEKAFLRGLRILESLAVPDHHALARTYSDLGMLYGTSGGRWSQAERALHIAHRHQMLASDPLDPDVARSLSNLANAMIHLGNLKGARELLEQALILIEKPPGSDIATAMVLNALGVLEITEGNAELSLVHLRRSVALWRQVADSNHPELIAPLLNSGRVYLQLHRASEALPLLREAQTIAEARLGPTHPVLAEVLGTCAEAYGKTGGRKEAKELARRSQAIFKLYPGRGATVSFAQLLRESHK